MNVIKPKSLLIILALAHLAAPTYAAEPRNVAIVIYEGVEVLDLAGPAEVLEIAGSYGRTGDLPAFRLYTVAPSADPVTSQNFLTLVPDHTPATAPVPDVLVIPGGQMRAVLGDEQFMGWLDRAMDSALTLTVCSGVSAPTQLGRLDGLEATTWHNLVDRLSQQHPEVDFQHGKRFVDNGNLITTAGVSAGIDGSLHLVARLLGLEVARETATYMEYPWTPEPYLVDSYPVLNPTLDAAGRAVQVGRMQLRSGDLEGAESTWRRALDKDPGNADLLYGLFQTLARMERWPEAIEVSLRIVPANPVRGYYNAASAAARSGRNDTAIEHLRAAIEAGFHNPAWIAADDDLASLHDDPRFESLLALAATEE